MPLGKLTESLGKKRAAHLLRRACFGASIADIDQFSNLTPQEAFERLYTDLPDPTPPIDPATGREWVITGTTDANSEGFELNRYLNAWMVDQAIASNVEDSLKISYSFRERLVFFLHTLFTTKASTVNNSRAIYFQQALFRKYAFDLEDRSRPDPESTTETPLPDIEIGVNLKELTKKICVDNAMLIFLDGRLNVKGSPNENYARELLELYTIGRGLEGNVPQGDFDGDYYYYTEQDVQEGAKVLSGFNFDENFINIDLDTNLPRGMIRGGGTIAGSHDNSVKTFSSRFESASISPDTELLLSGQPTEESLLDEISQLVDLIYNQSQTPIHICRRIYRFFVYHEITPELEADIIQEMANVFVANDYKLYYVLEALFTSSHFYDGDAGYTNDNFGGLIKSPFDLIVGYHKNFGLSLPPYDTSYGSFYDDYALPLLGQINVQGMDFYDPYEVAGYSAYHQYPIYNRSWITTNYLTNRYQFIQERTSNGISLQAGEVDVFNFVKSTIPSGVARDAQSLIISLAEYFLPVSENLSFTDGATSELTTDRLNYFLSVFLYSPQIDMDPEAAWTERWDNNNDTETMANQVLSLINAMLQSPEYQLM